MSQIALLYVGNPNAEAWIFNPIALRKAKIVCNFGLSECNRVNFLVGMLGSLRLSQCVQVLSVAGSFT